MSARFFDRLDFTTSIHGTHGDFMVSWEEVKGRLPEHPGQRGERTVYFSRKPLIAIDAQFDARDATRSSKGDLMNRTMDFGHSAVARMPFAKWTA